MAEGRRLVVRLESRVEQESLLRFLRERGCVAGADGETAVAVDDCEEAPPGLASLVALVEEWRRGTHEAVLELGERRTILRTEV